MTELSLRINLSVKQTKDGRAFNVQTYEKFQKRIERVQIAVTGFITIFILVILITIGTLSARQQKSTNRRRDVSKFWLTKFIVPLLYSTFALLFLSLIFLMVNLYRQHRVNNKDATSRCGIFKKEIIALISIFLVFSFSYFIRAWWYNKYFKY